MTANPRSFAKEEPREATDLDGILERNIRALVERRKEEQAAITWQGRVASRVTSFLGSFAFIYVHIVLFGTWIAANIFELPGIPHFDPGLAHLGTFAAIEAIFLTTFVLITQNRMAATAHKRAELDLQISLLTEYELTKLISVVAAVAERLRVKTKVDEELAELSQDVVVDAVLDKIESADDTVTDKTSSRDTESAT